MTALSFSLQNKTALVTGGTSGIGKAIAEAILAAGGNVVVGSRSEEKVESMRAELSTAYDAERFLALQLDVSDYATTDAAIEAGVEKFKALDVLVNCAGVNKKVPTLECSDDDLRWIMDVNFFGAVHAAKAFAEHVKSRDLPAGEVPCSIINIASVTSFLALSEVTAYACSKGAILALTRQLAVEWIQYGIRTTAIAPGFVPADQNRQILKSGDRGRRILENTPMERFGTPEEIASAVVYLASDAGKFLNGECINIDGGFMIHGVSDARPKSDFD